MESKVATTTTQADVGNILLAGTTAQTSATRKVAAAGWADPLKITKRSPGWPSAFSLLLRIATLNGQPKTLFSLVESSLELGFPTIFVYIFQYPQAIDHGPSC